MHYERLYCSTVSSYLCVSPITHHDNLHFAGVSAKKGTYGEGKSTDRSANQLFGRPGMSPRLGRNREINEKDNGHCDHTQSKNVIDYSAESHDTRIVSAQPKNRASHPQTSRAKIAPRR